MSGHDGYGANKKICMRYKKGGGSQAGADQEEMPDGSRSTPAREAPRKF